uniref:centromere protein F-like n=1 Tax=Pristiophorus japonicus TaxID=55135 RepID=UPI00398EF13B
MSWAVEEWKSELSSRALRKISEYEGQLEKLKKERQQKQLQLDSLEVAFQKQNQKLEGERDENAALKREAQSLTEEGNSLEKARQRLCHEIQVKETLVCSLEGQLLAAKKQVDNLEQRLKRLEAELERSQRTSAPADCQLHPATPTKSYPGCPTPSRASEGTKSDELQEKYNREVEEKKRLCAEVKALKLQVQQLQFTSNKSHRESGPQQIRASTFSWQLEKAPACAPAGPIGRGSPSSVFPWEQPRTPAHHSSRSPQQHDNKTSGLGSEPRSDHLGQLEESGSAQVRELQKENQVLQCTMSQLEVWVQSQEKEIKNHLNKLQETQSHLEKYKGELATKEQALSKSRDDLTRATVQQEQTRDKCALLEQKLKQLSEDLSCQRQNAESVRRLMEQKSKDKEKEHQQEMSDQQRAYRSLEHQSKQEKNQLNQEIQQLKTEQLALQSRLDKMVAQKQLVDRELEEVKAKFHWADKELAAHQRKGDDLQRNLQDALMEKDRVSTWQDQNTQRIVHLEAQLKRQEKQLTLSQKSREEIKTENLALASKLKDLQKKLDHEGRPDPGSEDLAVVSCQNDGSEFTKRGPHEEQVSQRSNDGPFENVGAAVGLPVKDEETTLDSMEGNEPGGLELRAKSANSDQGAGANTEEDHCLKTEAKLETELGGAPMESRSSEKARAAFPNAEEKVGFDKGAEEEFQADAAEAAVTPGDPAEEGAVATDWPDKPTVAPARLGELEAELEEVKSHNRTLQGELENAKEALKARAAEGQRDQQSLAELRGKLKQAMQQSKTECSGALVMRQRERFGGPERGLARLQEMSESEDEKVWPLARRKDGLAGSNEDEIQVLQNAASKKMQQLEQQIVDLNSEKSCIEEIIKANGGPVDEGDDESRDLLLEYFKHKDIQNLELNELSSSRPGHLCSELRASLEHKLGKEKARFMDIMKGGDGGGADEKGGRELFLAYLKHKVVEQFEFNEQLLEHQRQLGVLQAKCAELTREKEQEGEARRRAQDKFDNLQSKIHRETQQLTVALEDQSRNIEGLLSSMEDKEQTIQGLNRRLQGTLKLLACLRRENGELKTSLKLVLEKSKQKCARPPGGAGLDRSDCGPFPQAEQENDCPLPGGRSGSRGRAPLLHGSKASAGVTPQKSEPGHEGNVFDGSLLRHEERAVDSSASREEDPKAASPIGAAAPNPIENPEKRAQRVGKMEAGCSENVIHAVPKEQGASFVPSAAAPLGKPGAATVELKQDSESLRQRQELDCEEGHSSDAAQCRQSVQHPGGVQMKIGASEQEVTVLRAEAPRAEAETATKERAEEVAGLLASEEKQSDEELRTGDALIEEAEGVIGRLKEALKVSEEEPAMAKESNQKAVRALNAELNGFSGRCTILEREKGRLCLEGREAQEVVGDARSKKEDLADAIRSGQALPSGRSEERDCLRRELGVLQEWKQKVLEDVAALEAEKESGLVERRALQDSVLEMRSQMEALQGELEARQGTVERARQLQQELAQTQSEKLALQNQVNHLQKTAAGLTEEKIELRGRLEQWTGRPEAEEEGPSDCLWENGLSEDLLPTSSQHQGTAHTTASKLGADLEALKRALQEKSEEAERNFRNYSDLLNARQELAASNESLVTTAEPPNDGGADPADSGRGRAAGRQPRTASEGGQQAAGESAEAGGRGPVEASQRTQWHTEPAELSARLNPAQLAMKINPAELAARIQRNRQFKHHLSVAFDETEYEPCGLPDVVQKGFADIPTGPSCPHILRRANLNRPQPPGQGLSLLGFFNGLAGDSKQ